MLKTRLATAAVAIPILLVAVGYGGLAFMAVVLFANVAGLLEFQRLRPFPDDGPRDVLGVAITVVAGSMLVVAFHVASHASVGAALTVGVLLPLARAVFGEAEMLARARRALHAIAGIVYVSFLLGHIVALRALPHGALWVVFLLGVVMMADTGAYFAGRWFGRTPLSPVSPKKTVEGSIGGLVASASFAAGVTAFGPLGLEWWHGPLLAVPAALMSQVGDLAESLLKRSFGVKDSGKLIPGHGGLLDRFDGMLGAAIFVLITAPLTGYPPGLV